jgi:hypothetical protein
VLCSGLTWQAQRDNIRKQRIIHASSNQHSWAQAAADEYGDLRANNAKGDAQPPEAAGDDGEQAGAGDML